MKIILTNDDGIDAPGLAALVAACNGRGEITVIAPASEQSGVGHALTTRRDIEAEQLDRNRWKVHGTPADCARIALSELVPDAAWLLSGVNRGGNLGVDVFTSGTVAAAREAAIHGVPSMALSQYVAPGRELDWELTARRVGRILDHKLGRDFAPGTFLNLNLPHPEHGDEELPFRSCPVDKSPLQIRFRREGGLFRYDGNYHARKHVEGTDIHACFQGFISLSELSV
jgi:5'-nucleotidase